MRSKRRMMVILFLVLLLLLVGCFSRTKQFTLTIRIEGEGVVHPVSGNQYNSGARVTVNATPSKGWFFDHWGGAHGSSVAENRIVMDGDKSITAVFLKQNLKPVATDDLLVTDQNKAVVIDILANDTDVDGDSLDVTEITQPAHGKAVLNHDQTITYTPNQDYFGADQFTYTISDGKATDQGTVKLTVQEVVKPNTPPVANLDQVSTDEDTKVNFDPLTNDTDADQDSLSIVQISDPTHGTVLQEMNGSLTYTPKTNFFGTDQFTYKIADGQGGESEATVEITIHGVNDLPIIEDYYLTVNSEVPQSIDVLATATDVEDEAWEMQITSLTQPPVGEGVAVIEYGEIYYTPSSGFLGETSFTYTVTDTDGGTATATVWVTVVEAGKNVSGSFNISAQLAGSTYVVALNPILELDPETPPAAYIVDVIPSETPTVNYALDAPAGDYYLYILVDANNSYVFGDIDDYVAIYGSTYPEHPVNPNVTVSTAPIQLEPVDLILLTGELNFLK